jgi:hypothetical protein
MIMAKYTIVVTGDGVELAEETFEADTETAAAFKAGISVGAYLILGMPIALQEMVGDSSIERYADSLTVTVSS